VNTSVLKSNNGEENVIRFEEQGRRQGFERPYANERSVVFILRG
jgi:hypothetical protein